MGAHRLQNIIVVLVNSLLLLLARGAHGQAAECPPSELIPGCPCYNFEDGLFLECAGANEDTLRSTLLGVMNSAGKFINPFKVKNFTLDCLLLLWSLTRFSMFDACVNSKRTNIRELESLILYVLKLIYRISSIIVTKNFRWISWLNLIFSLSISYRWK